MLRPGTWPKGIKASNFGIHYRKSTSYDTPTVPFYQTYCGYQRLWDAGVTGIAINPSNGVWDLTRLQATCTFARSNGMKVVVTLGSFAAYMTGGTTNNNGQGAAYNALPPTDNNQVIAYVQTVVNAVNAIMGTGQIWETWNEPEFFWLGTADQLVSLHNLMYDTIKAIDPSAIVTTPSVTPASGVDILTEFPTWKIASMLPKADAVAFHPYCYQSQPEAMGLMAQQAKGWIIGQGYNLPLFATEWTWHAFKDLGGTAYPGPTYTDYLASASSVMAQDQAAAYFHRALLTQLGQGADLSIWYGVDMWWSALRVVTDLQNPTTPTALISAMAYIQGLIGAGVILNLGYPVNKAFLADKTGKKVTAMWCTDGVTQTVDISGFTSGTDVYGNAITLSSTYSLGFSPIYLK